MSSMDWRQALLRWRIQFRRGTTDAWESANPVLLLGEPGWDVDLLRMKIGDGETAWNDLLWASLDPTQLQEILDLLEDLPDLDDERMSTVIADVGSDFFGLLSDYVESVTADYIPLTQRGANNGVATLDSGGKLPTSQLPTSVMDFKGAWNASTNSPTLVDGTGDAGDQYRVSVAGTRNLGSGSIVFDIGDAVIYSGTVWQKYDNTESVSSVAGKTGVVVLARADVGLDDAGLDTAMTGVLDDTGSDFTAGLNASIAAYRNVFKVTTFTTAGVQATLAAADALAGGGTIYMPEAAYDYTAGHVLLPDNDHSFKFTGDGIGRTVINKAANTRAFYRPVSTNVAGTYIFEDIEWVGQGGQGNAENHTDMAVHIADATGALEHRAVFINRCKATKCNSEVFYTAAALNVYTDNIVDDCAFTAFNPVSGNPANRNSFVHVTGNTVSNIGNDNGSGNGIETVAASIIIADNDFIDLTATGIVARAHHQVSVHGNTLNGWTGSTVNSSSSAIYVSRSNAVWNGPGVVNVTGNTVTNWTRGVVVSTSADTDVLTEVTVASNTINTTKREAIWIQPFAGAIKYPHVVGNSIVDAGQDAHNTYDAIRIGYTNSTATSGTVTRPVVQANTVACSTGVKVKYAVNILAGGANPITVTDALIRANDFRDCWATSMTNDTGTNTVRIGNLPGGALPYAWVTRGVYFWVDATGSMRLKATAPATDTDGAAFSTTADLTTAVASAVSSAVATAIAAAVLTATKTTDQTVNNSTTAVADTQLVIPMAANSVYEYSGYLRTESSTVADFRLGMDGPGSSTASWGAMGSAVSVTTGGVGSGLYQERSMGQTAVFGGAGAGNTLIVRPTGRIVTGATAGNFTVMFAQGAPEASDTKLLAGSFITLRKIS